MIICWLYKLLVDKYEFGIIYTAVMNVYCGKSLIVEKSSELVSVWGSEYAL